MLVGHPLFMQPSYRYEPQKKKTSVDWPNFVRDLCVENYVRTKFGGIVEVDESLFGRSVKQLRGRPLGKRIRIVEVLERNTNRNKLFPVD